MALLLFIERDAEGTFGGVSAPGALQQADTLQADMAHRGSRLVVDEAVTSGDSTRGDEQFRALEDLLGDILWSVEFGKTQAPPAIAVRAPDARQADALFAALPNPGRTSAPVVRDQGTPAGALGGAQAHNAINWHDAGFKGKGVKIGIIDSGFARLMNVSTDHRPENFNFKCFHFPGTLLWPESRKTSYSECNSTFGGGTHGTGAVEMVFDMAPEATYYLGHVGSRADSAKAIQWFRSNGVHVIVATVSFGWEGRGNGRSEIQESLSTLGSAATAIRGGALFVAPTGNVFSSWYGAFTDADNDGLHEFATDDECNEITVGSGQSVKLALRWQDAGWGSARRNLTLQIRDSTGATVLAASSGPQSGSANHRPVEELSYTATAAGTLCVMVHYSGSSDPSWIQLYGRSHYLGNRTGSHSIEGMGELVNAGALTVGAADHRTPSTIQAYSGRGPLPIGNHIKPDIVGADGAYFAVSSGRAFGTSWSTPTVAGLAVLVKQRFAAYNGAQIATYIKNNALPRGDTVPNNTWGYGFAYLPHIGPTITGRAQVDETLSVDTSTIADADGIPAAPTFTYQWVRISSGTESDLSGQTNSTYSVTTADQGATLKVKVGFTDSEGNSVTQASLPTFQVAPPNMDPTGAPSISGTLRVGSTLTASTSAISDSDGLTSVSYEYQWIRVDGTTERDIAGATDSTYVLVRADLSKTIKVRVSFTDDNRNRESLASAATTAIKPEPNDPPSFPSTETGARSVDENTPANRSIGARLAATDPENDSLTYSIQGGSALFSISSTGQLRTKGALDHESASSHTIVVQVTDNKDIDGMADTTIDSTLVATITVTDVDEPPQITLASAGGAAVTVDGGAVGVNENYDGALLTVSASDPERTHTDYTLTLGGTHATSFDLSASGELDFKSPPDHETRSAYRLTLIASNSEERGTLAVTVTVADVNEPPVVGGPATVNWSENRTGTLGTYTKSDPDRPQQTTSWGAVGSSTVLSGPNSAAFEFAQSTGRLTFEEAPDYEDGGGSYEVTLTANDGSLEGALTVTVNVANENEDGELRLSKRTPIINSSITATLTDPDNVVSSSWGWQRSTRPNTGWIDITGANSNSYTPVADDRNYYLRANVTYEDGHGPDKKKQAVTEFRVTNDRRTNIAPVLPDTVAAISIPENSRPGRNVGSPVRATDAERDPLSYSLSGASEFAIGSTTGQITVAPAGTFDFDAGTQSYSLTVSVADGFGGTDSADVTVNITDVNEAPSAVDDAATVLEDGTIEIDVLANDSDPEDDGDELTVSVTRSPRNGSVLLNSPQNPGDRYTVTYTPRANYFGSDNFVYRVRDSGSPALSASATVTLAVTSVNDGPSFGTATSLTRTVSETATESDRVGAPVTATDPEDDELTYNLSGADSFAFGIGSDSGQITVGPGTTFDAAAQSGYSVIVEARDPEGSTASIDVTITVTTRPVRAPISFGGGGAGGGAAGGGPPPGPTPSDVDFEWSVKRDIEALDSGHDKPTGMWSDGAVLWILQNGDGADDAAYAYDLATGERVEDREFELARTNRAPRGIWSNGTTVWVSDSGQDRLFAYDIETGDRDEERELELAGRNDDARAIWSDGETIRVLDARGSALFAYRVSDGVLLAEYELSSANGDPRGLWSDGVTVWVSDHGAKRIFAYRLPEAPAAPAAEDTEAVALERVRDEEFGKLARASNNSPRGIWSVGALMYVVDASDGKVYSYNMPDAIDARLASLTLEGIEIGDFSPLRTEYAGVPGDGVTETTVEVEAAQGAATVAIEPADADAAAEGHHIALDGVGEIAVTVTSADESRSLVYRVRLPEAEERGPCLGGAVRAGFSLVVYEGGSVDDLVACARTRHVTAVYALSEGAYVSYIPGAPEFVNERFRALFPDGIPALTPLVVGSRGPATADPGAPAIAEPFAVCLRGAITGGFSLVVYEGGSVDDLDACAETLGVSAVYVLHDGAWVSYILGAPEFVNAAFAGVHGDGLPALTPLGVSGE